MRPCAVTHSLDMDQRAVQLVVGPGTTAGTLMLSPTQVFRDGRFLLSIGTPGSYGILQTTPQMILNALVFGMNVQEAIEAPRVRVYRDRAVDVETRIPAAANGVDNIAQALGTIGYEIATGWGARLRRVLVD